MRDNWWHLIAFAPIAVLVGGFVGGYIGAMVLFLTILPYPVAMWGDVKYVRAEVDSEDEDDEPSAAVWIALGLVVLVTLGLLSLLVSPVYVYLRRQWLA